MGGKLYRQGLIKMNEFVTQCDRDRIPIIWIQDTSGIDVGDIAEKAELLGLGQSLIYSIESTKLPMMLVVLRKGTAAAHYVMGGPTANNHTAFTLGTAATEINVMHGETAAAASYARRLVKEKDAGKPLGPVIAKMNEMVEHYRADVAADLLCEEGVRGRGGAVRGDPGVPDGLCQRGVPESPVDLPAAPPDAAAADPLAGRHGAGHGRRRIAPASPQSPPARGGGRP